MSRSVISPREFAELCKLGKSIELIDVRTPIEFQEAHLEQARNIPLDRLNVEELLKTRGCESSEPIYVICKAGGRGQKACEKIQSSGFDNVINIEGGTMACIDAGLPVVRGRKVMSLERQVRIVAGAMVFVGALLGVFVHPGFSAISGFIGAGLVFAGVSNTCAMGMVLAKMPWNQGPPQSCNK